MKPSVKRTGILLVCALALLAAGGYFVGIPMWEKAKAEAVKTYISQIPGSLKVDNAEVHLLENRVVLHGLAGTCAYFPDAPFDISASQITLAGLNWDAASSKGVVKLVDKLHLVDFSIKTEKPEVLFGYSGYAYRDYMASGLWLNYSLLSTSGKPGNTLKDALPLLLSARSGPVTAIGFSGEFPAGHSPAGATYMSGAKIAIEKSHIDSFSLLQVGPIASNNIVVTLQDGTAATVDNFTSSGYALSEIHILMTTDPEHHAQMVEQDPLVFFKENFRFEKALASGFRIQLPNKSRIEASSFAGNFSVGGGELTYQFGVRDLIIPAEAYQDKTPAAEFLAEKLQHKPLELSLNFSLNTVREGNEVRIVLDDTYIHEKTLGNASMQFEISGTAPSVPNQFPPIDTASASFAGGKMVLEDKGWLPLLFEMNALLSPFKFTDDGHQETGPELRKRVVRDMIAGGKDTENKDIIAMSAALGRFLAESGSLTIESKPEKPLQFFFMNKTLQDNPGALKITTTYTPPAQ